MIDNTEGPSLEEQLNHLDNLLAKPRAEAAREVNWLLGDMATHIKTELDNDALTSDLWSDSLGDRMVSLGQDASVKHIETDPVVAHFADLASPGMSKSAEAMKSYSEKSLSQFNDRRAVFAEMLDAVRDSRRVLLFPETITKINSLNEDGFLAYQLGMNDEDFAAYYGSGESQSISTQSPQVSHTDIDYSLQPIAAAESPAISFESLRDVYPVAGTYTKPPVHEAAKETRATPVTTVAPQIPEEVDVEPVDIDFER